MLGAILGSLVGWQPALAYTSTSPHYQIPESFLGGSGSINSTSSHYQSQGAAGAPAVGGQYPAGGNSSSTHYQTNGGSVTTNDPALSFSVNGTTSINFGNLSPSATATATSTFNVIDYTSFGYIVQVVGTPPTSGSHTLTAMTGGGSTLGTEQFGINLKANTTPSIGANPSGGVGAAYGAYSTANSFKYASNDTIAQGPKSSAQTNFTVSYIANASSTTPGGAYTGTLTFICTGTY